MELWDEEQGDWTSTPVDYGELLDGKKDAYESTAIIHPFGHRQFRAMAQKLVIPPMVLDLMLKGKDRDYLSTRRPRSTWKPVSAPSRPIESSRNRERAANRYRSRSPAPRSRSRAKDETTWTGKMGGVRGHTSTSPPPMRPSRGFSAAIGRGVGGVRVGGATSSMKPKISGRGRALSLRMRAERGGAPLRKPGRLSLKSFPKTQQQQQPTTAASNDKSSRKPPQSSISLPRRQPSTTHAPSNTGLQLHSDWPELNSDPKPQKTTPNWSLPNPVKPVISSPKRNSKSPSFEVTNVSKSSTATLPTTEDLIAITTKHSDSRSVTNSTQPSKVEANNSEHILSSSMVTEVPTVCKEDAPLITNTTAAATKSRPRKQARPRNRTKDYHRSRPRNFRAVYNSAESSDDVTVVHSSSDYSEFNFDDTFDEQTQSRYQHDCDGSENNQLPANILETACHTDDDGTSMLSVPNLSLSSLAATRDDEGSGGVFSMSHPPQTNGLLSVVADLPECLVNQSDDEVIMIAREENPFVSREEDPVIIMEIREEEKPQEGEKGLHVNDESSQPEILEIPCETLVGEREDIPVINNETTNSESSRDQCLELKDQFMSVALASGEAPLINDSCSQPVTSVKCGEDPVTYEERICGKGEETVGVEGTAVTGENSVISEEEIREEPAKVEGGASLAIGEDPVIIEKNKEEPEEAEGACMSIAGGENLVMSSSKVEPVSFVVGGGMEPAISGTQVNSEMEAEAADNLSVSVEREEEEDVPFISDGTTNSHISSLDGDESQRVDQSALSSVADKDIEDRAATEPGSNSLSQSEDIPAIKEDYEVVSIATDDITLRKDAVAAASSEDVPVIKDDREKNGPNLYSQNEVESATEFLPVEPDPIIKVSDKEGKIWDILLTSTAMSSQVKVTAHKLTTDLEKVKSSAHHPSPPESDATTNIEQVLTAATDQGSKPQLSADQDSLCTISPEGDVLLPNKGGAPLIKNVSLPPSNQGTCSTDISEKCSDMMTIVEGVEGDDPLIKETTSLAPEQDDTGISKNYPSPSSLPTEDAPLIFFTDDIDCSNIHPCPLLPENLPSPLISEWDAPLNSTANESFDNLPSPLLSIGDISLTFITDENFQSPLLPEEGDTPTISTINESSENILLVDGDVPQISTTNESSEKVTFFQGDAPSISSVEGSSEDPLQLKGGVPPSQGDDALAPPNSEILESILPYQGDAPLISSIEMNFDETSLPVFQLEDSDSDDQESTESCTETTSLSSASEDSRDQRSSGPHGNRCITTAPPIKQAFSSTQLVPSLSSIVTGHLNAAPPCSVKTEGGLQSSDSLNGCQLLGLSERREKQKEEDNNKNNNSIPQSDNITQIATVSGQEFDKNMSGICSSHSSLSPSPSPTLSPSHPHPSLPSAAQVVTRDNTTATQVVASEDCPSSLTNQGESLSLEWEHDDQTLYFTNLPSQITAEELEQMIEPFGEISHCQVFISPTDQNEVALSEPTIEDISSFGLESSESDSSCCYLEWKNQLKLPRCSAFVRMVEKSTCNWVISYFHGNPLDGSSMLVKCGYIKDQAKMCEL